MPNFIDERVWDLLASLTNRINQKRMNEKPLTHEELRLIMQHINGKDTATSYYRRVTIGNESRRRPQ